MKKFPLIVLTNILLASCNVDELEFDDIQITGGVDFPLGEIKYTMRELIEEQDDDELELKEDSISLLSLYYTDTISYDADDEFVKVEEISESGSFSTIPVDVGPATINISERFSRSYETRNDEELDSLFYNTGNLALTVTSTANATLNYTITFENTRVVGPPETPIIFTGTIVGSGADNQLRSLVNHVTRLTDPSGSNDYIINFDASIGLAAGQSLNGTEQISFDFTYINRTFNTIYGKFDQDTIQIDNQTLDIEFFRDTGDKGIFFGNPIIRFTLDNSFGIPISADFSGIYGSNEDGSNQAFLTGAITEVPLPEMASADLNNPGDVAQSIIEINRDNSNIVNLLSTSPGQLIFDVQGISNLNNPNQLNFVQPGNEINGLIEIEIPMEVRLENLSQSITLSLGDGLDDGNVDSAFLRVVTINELPFSGTLILEIQDADSNTLHTVVDDNLVLNAPFINIQGFVTDPSRTSVDIPLSPESIEALNVGSNIVITTILNTPSNLASRDIFVKVLADYELEVKIGVGVVGQINIDI